MLGIVVVHSCFEKQLSCLRSNVFQNCVLTFCSLYASLAYFFLLYHHAMSLTNRNVNTVSYLSIFMREFLVSICNFDRSEFSDNVYNFHFNVWIFAPKNDFEPFLASEKLIFSRLILFDVIWLYITSEENLVLSLFYHSFILTLKYLITISIKRTKWKSLSNMDGKEGQFDVVLN